MWKIVLTAAIVAVAVAIADPLPPRWPAQFSQHFSEGNTYPVMGTYKTEGEFYYDATNSQYRVDREHGRGDRYCWLNGLHIFGYTKCSHIVQDGIRYLYYPDNNECCACCEAKHGCGILRQDWLSGAEFVGEVVINGVEAFQWNKAGL